MFVDGLINKENVAYIHTGILFNHKKEGNPTNCDNMVVDIGSLAMKGQTPVFLFLPFLLLSELDLPSDQTQLEAGDPRRPGKSLPASRCRKAAESREGDLFEERTTNTTGLWVWKFSPYFKSKSNQDIEYLIQKTKNR